eukprot:GHVL01025227.1.p1 GENE.GHVL01025227.1~~GHVL01025227.1.p1  ORF type:complete len:212 (+),score=36.18 GHVL01025227.1:656-1291(+)
MGRESDDSDCAGEGSSKQKQSLLVRNLHYDTSPDTLWQEFDKHGVVTDVYVPLDYFTGKPRGFGFVEMQSHKDASSAIKALNHHRIDGSEIDIVFAEERRKSPGTMRRISRVNGDRRGGDRRGDDRRGDDRRGDYRRDRRRSLDDDRRRGDERRRSQEDRRRDDRHGRRRSRDERKHTSYDRKHSSDNRQPRASGSRRRSSSKRDTSSCSR